MMIHVMQQHLLQITIAITRFSQLLVLLHLLVFLHLVVQITMEGMSGSRSLFPARVCYHLTLILEYCLTQEWRYTRALVAILHYWPAMITAAPMAICRRSSRVA